MRTAPSPVTSLLPPRLLSLLALGALIAPSAWAQCTTIVPSDPNPLIAGASLQAAILAAGTNDVLCIQPGIYQGNFVIGNDITLQPTGAPQSVILDGGGSGTVLTIFSVTNATQIRDLVVRNGNSFGDGGGVSILDASPRISGCRIENNSATGSGGGIHVLGLGTAAIPHITACQVVSNSAGEHGGGIAFVGETGILATGVNSIITNTTVRLNTAGNASFGLGGGIYAGVSFGTGVAPRLSIWRSRVNENVVNGSGGGIAAIYGVRLDVDHSTVQANASTWEGGGVWCEYGCWPTVRSCYVAENQAVWRGGGLFLHLYDQGDIRHSVFEHNQLSDAGSLGGGIFIGNTGGSYNGGNPAEGPPPTPQPGDPHKMDVRNNLIIGNQSADGGGVAVEYATPLFAFNTLEGNIATVQSTGGMLVDNFSPTGFVVQLVVRNSIHWGDQGTLPPALPWQVEFRDVNWASTLEFNDVRFRASGGWPYAASNIDADPLWVNGYTCPLSPNGSYFLSQPTPPSPCVDAAMGGLPGMMAGRVTNPTGAADVGVADIGYHYPPPTCP